MCRTWAQWQRFLSLGEPHDQVPTLASCFQCLAFVSHSTSHTSPPSDELSSPNALIYNISHTGFVWRVACASIGVWPVQLDTQFIATNTLLPPFLTHPHTPNVATPGQS